MDWTSFWPDLLVGAATGLMVGLVLLVAERWIAHNAARRTVTEMQERAVAEAVTLLENPFDYRGEDLAPAKRNLKKLKRVVQRVPIGQGSELVVGWEAAVGVVRTADRLDVYIESVQKQIEELTERNPVTNRVSLLPWIARLGREEKRSWEAPTGYRAATAVEITSALRGPVDMYLHQRQLLDAYRDAFQTAMGIWQFDGWAVEVDTPEKPIRWYSRWRSNRALRRRTADVKKRAESAAQDIVYAVSSIG